MAILFSAGSASLGYDARGNLTNSGGIGYSYTSDNLLKGMSNGVTLSYDPVGRLSDYGQGTRKRFVYDGDNIAAEYDSSGNPAPQQRYVWGPGTDELLVWYEGADDPGDHQARTRRQLPLRRRHRNSLGILPLIEARP